MDVTLNPEATAPNPVIRTMQHFVFPKCAWPRPMRPLRRRRAMAVVTIGLLSCALPRQGVAQARDTTAPPHRRHHAI
ncbi:MAG: hypothetical protein ABI877_02745, partial [Gemmatimonadaceae bacterium]